MEVEDYRLRTYDYSAARDAADSFDAMIALFYGIGRGILRDVEKSEAPTKAGPARPSPRAGVKEATAAADKRSRDRDAARSLGISVEELKALRRAKAERDLVLHAQAARLGTTVRELRRRRLA
ncbi:MAG: hypothetical protein KY452_06320 [Actinobacteria bacterium]|nr:hypothetical protein [Actinomycetota bacterium]